MSRLQAAARWGALAVGLGAVIGPAWADFPPVILNVELSTTPCEPADGRTPWVFGESDCLLEEQTLFVCLEIQDLDFNSVLGSSQQDIVLITMRSAWVPFIDQAGLEYGPEPPPVPTDRSGLFNDATTNSDFYTAFAPEQGNVTDRQLEFFVPQFFGPNEARLRGLIPYDVHWVVEITVKNQTTSTNVVPDSVLFDVCALENPNLVAGNPAPVADAGADQVVSVGETVELDASRSFDRSDVGFSPFDPGVFDKDLLSYAWEWMDGPERVDPEIDPAIPAGIEPQHWPIALVTLEVPNTDAKPYYVYRVTVDDGVNSPPSTADVRIKVEPLVRANRPPNAVITDATGKVVSSGTVSARVGDEIKLSAQLSSDPDGDPLMYHWRQTNEAGGALAADELLTDFQPLNGVTSPDVSWEATQTGTFYFNLLVTDEPPLGLTSLSASANVTVDVSEAATASEIVGRESDLSTPTTTGDGQSSAAQPAAPASCGAGSILPLALVGAGLWLVRGRLGGRRPR
jgi:hypothetical protein